MKLLIEMPVEIYDGIIVKLERLSREYSILKNGMIVRHSEAGDDERVLEIVCEHEEAIMLLDSATRLYPDAASAIANAIDKALR